MHTLWSAGRGFRDQFFIYSELILPVRTSITMATRNIQDLLNFDDPLNLDAAHHYERDKVSHI